MRRVWMVFAAVMICWGVQAQEGFDAKMRRAGLVDVLAVDSTLRVKLMYSAPDNFMRRDVYGDLETAYLLPHFARKVAAAQRLLRAICPECKEPVEPNEKLLRSLVKEIGRAHV